MSEDFNACKRRALHLKSASYQLISGILFIRNFDYVLLRCLEKEEALKVLSSLHEGLAGGHFGAEVTTNKILRVGYYWATLFKDSYVHIRKCEECQKSVGREKRLVFPLQPIDGGKNCSQQRGSLPAPQVPIRLTNFWYGRINGVMDPLPF